VQEDVSFEVHGEECYAQEVRVPDLLADTDGPLPETARNPDKTQRCLQV